MGFFFDRLKFPSALCAMCKLAWIGIYRVVVHFKNPKVLETASFFVSQIGVLSIFLKRIFSRFVSSGGILFVFLGGGLSSRRPIHAHNHHCAGNGAVAQPPLPGGLGLGGAASGGPHPVLFHATAARWGGWRAGAGQRRQGCGARRRRPWLGWGVGFVGSWLPSPFWTR